MAKLQVALEFTNLNDALKVATLCADSVDVIEIGTPLIKAEGMDAVKVIKEKFPGKLVSADMKIMDTGFLEAELAFNHGADIASVLGVADDATIKGAVDAARKHNKKIIADMIGCKDIAQRSKELEALGIDIIEIHKGIDQQNAGHDGFSSVEKIAKSVKTKLAVAGGLNKDTVGQFVSFVEIIIVGGAITKSPNPKQAAKEIRDEIYGTAQKVAAGNARSR